MSDSLTLANQELMRRAPYRAHKNPSSQLVETSYFQHALTSFKRVRLSKRVKLS